MAIDIQRRTDSDARRRMRLVETGPDHGQTGAMPEEFVSSPTARLPSGRRFLRPLVLGLLVACVAVAIIVVLRSGSAGKTSVVRTAPSRASATANALGAPMSIAASSVDTDVATRTYRAAVSIRNPNDVAATGVTVRVTFLDASGSALKTEERTVDVLGSGRTALLDFSGELDPGAPAPATVDVTATAARLELLPPSGA